MKAVLYYSKALITVDEATAWDIARVSAEYNRQNSINGYLCFYKAHFFQYIEGETKSLKNVFAQIHADSRHQITWHMRYLRMSESPDTDLEWAIAKPIPHGRHRARSDRYWDCSLARTLNTLTELHRHDELIDTACSVH